MIAVQRVREAPCPPPDATCMIIIALQSAFDYD